MKPFDIKQKIVIWILLLVGVFFLSDFLINVGINSTYQPIERVDDQENIVTYQADATYVNGRIRGVIKEPKASQKKYLKIELYSKRDVLVGRGYIQVEKKQEEAQSFELLFRAKDVSYYKTEFVNEKEEGMELEVLPKELTKPEIVLATIVTFLIFWG